MANSGTEKRQKTISVKLRLDPEESREIERKAAAADMNVSQFLRAAALRRQVTARTDREVVTQLSKIGGLLRKATKQTSDAERRKEIARVLDQLQAAVQELMSKPGNVTVADRLAPYDNEPDGEPAASGNPKTRGVSKAKSETASKSVSDAKSRAVNEGERDLEDELDFVGEH